MMENQLRQRSVSVGGKNWRSFIRRRFAQPGQSLHLFHADSHLPGTRERLKTVRPLQGIDFLFIDGDHTYENAKADFGMYSLLVRQGGIAFLLSPILGH